MTGKRAGFEQEDWPLRGLSMVLFSEKESEDMDHESRPFELGKNRIEALSDGVFAIAMTLLILEFHIPNLPPNAPNVMVVPALWHLWPKFVTYAISFVSLGVYWI